MSDDMEPHECSWGIAECGCGDDNCLVVCEECGEEDRACDG